MDNKIRITIEYEHMFDVSIDFLDNEETKKTCHFINDFWGGEKERLEKADGCIYKCATRLIANEIIRLQMRSSFYCGIDAPKEAFNKGIEGFYPIDGTHGIELYAVDDFELNDLDFSFSKETIT